MKKLIGMLCAFAMCTSIFCQTAFAEDSTLEAKDSDSEIIYFEDKTLEKLVADKVDSNGDGKVSTEEIKYLDSLDASGQGITSLVGMEYTDLVTDPGAGTGYDFSDNNITDLSPLVPAIKNYIHVDLRNNQITDLSLLSQLNLYSVAYSGNPASAEEYFNAWNLPTDIYLPAATSDHQSFKVLMYINPYSFVGNADFNEAFGFSDFVSDDESLVGFFNTGVDLGLLAGEKTGETNVYVCHGDEKYTIRVHVGNPQATVNDVIAKDVSVKVDANSRKNILDFLEPDSALWTVNNYVWTSNNENVVKVDGDELVFVGNGQATITGTMQSNNIATYSNDNGVISFTITVELTQSTDVTEPTDDSNQSGNSSITTTPNQTENQENTSIQTSQSNKEQQDVPETSDASMIYLYAILLMMSGGYVIFNRVKALKK